MSDEAEVLLTKSPSFIAPSARTLTRRYLACALTLLSALKAALQPRNGVLLPNNAVLPLEAVPVPLLTEMSAIVEVNCP